MRLILLDLPQEPRQHFDPLALGRPIFELRCGTSSLAEKLVARTAARDVACFVPPYMAEAYREQCPWPVNDPAQLHGDDLLLVNGRVQADAFEVESSGPGVACFDAGGHCVFAFLPRAESSGLDHASIESLLASARTSLPQSPAPPPPMWNYVWELILQNSRLLTREITAAGLSGIEGSVEQPFALRGSRKDLYIAAGAVVHPMVVIDASRGPVYIDRDVHIHPFTRIEGPCYIGPQSVLVGGNCRAGTSIGPMCRVGGEVEASIIHGYSNKYHDGFLGHAYVGQWVNLGAQTTNSDLKNDYTNVSVILDGKRPIDTGSAKVGSLIGDHCKTSIGTLLNTGAYVGAMAVIATTGKLLPKFIPSFGWLLKGVLTEGYGMRKLFAAAKTAMARRGQQWTTAQEAMWEKIYALTAEPRNEAIRRNGRRVPDFGKTVPGL